MATDRTLPEQQGKKQEGSERTHEVNPFSVILSAEEWLVREPDNVDPIIGSTKQQIVRPLTKNLILGPEKSLKTTLTERLMLGLSCGETVFTLLPVPKCFRVLYLHGELSPDEIAERTRAAAKGMPRPLHNFFQGRDFRLHLAEPAGKVTLEKLLEEHEPQILVLDPLQSFIPGLDENTFKDMSPVTSYLDRMIATYNITLFLVVHKGKDHRRGVRGHSCLSGWRDTLFTLNYHQASKNLTVKVEPRWAAPVEPFNLEFRDGTLWPTNKTIYSTQSKRIREFVIKNGGSATKAELKDHLKISADAFRKALKRAGKAVKVTGNQITVRDKIVVPISGRAT